MDAPRIPPPEAMRFSFPLRTRWSDEDSMGVLNNAVYLTLLEEGRYRWCERLGLLSGFSGFGFVLAASNLRFVAPGRGGAEVELLMATTALGQKSFTQAYCIRDAAGAIWLEAEAVLVIWDQARRRAAPMPDEFRSAILRHEPTLTDAGPDGCGRRTGPLEGKPQPRARARVEEKDGARGAPWVPP